MALTYEHPEDVLERLLAWQREAQDTALVFITQTQGGAVRAPGALLAVSSDHSVGYISGGCIDADVTLQARRAIEANEARALRYGAGSPFVDLPLPCGGAIEVLIVPFPEQDEVQTICDRLRARERVTLCVSKTDGAIGLSASHHIPADVHHFTYHPKLRLRIAGRGADALALAKLSEAAGYKARLQLLDPDDIEIAKHAGLTEINRLESPSALLDVDDDPWTAFVLLFHDPSWETPLLLQALAGPAFYVGAVGSKRTHERRCDALRLAKANERDIARIRGPIGLVPSLRDASMLAVSTLAEIIESFPGTVSAKRPKTAYILLAAGQSSRFATGDKLLADLDGFPVLEHAGRQVEMTAEDVRYAVVRTEDVQRSKVLEELGWTVLTNPDAEQGQSTSLTRAIDVVMEHADIDQAVILLGDMPRINPEHISSLLEAAKREDVTAIMSRTGALLSPPALFKREHFDSLAKLTGDQGAKRLFNAIETGTVTLEIDEESAQDVDTVADLARIRESALA